MPQLYLKAGWATLGSMHCRSLERGLQRHHGGQKAQDASKAFRLPCEESDEISMEERM